MIRAETPASRERSLYLTTDAESFELGHFYAPWRMGVLRLGLHHNLRAAISTPVRVSVGMGLGAEAGCSSRFLGAKASFLYGKPFTSFFGHASGRFATGDLTSDSGITMVSQIYGGRAISDWFDLLAALTLDSIRDNGHWHSSSQIEAGVRWHD